MEENIYVKTRFTTVLRKVTEVYILVYRNDMINQIVLPDLSNRTKPNKKLIEPNRTPIVRLGWAIEQNRTPILL